MGSDLPLCGVFTDTVNGNSLKSIKKRKWWGFSWWPAKAGDTGSIPEPGRSHLQLSLCTIAAELVL